MVQGVLGTEGEGPPATCRPRVNCSADGVSLVPPAPDRWPLPLPTQERPGSEAQRGPSGARSWDGTVWAGEAAGRGWGHTDRLLWSDGIPGTGPCLAGGGSGPFLPTLHCP